MSILKDIIGKFSPPITLPMFLLGVVLLLIGFTTGVNIPNQGISLISEPSFRAYAIVFGGVCVVLSLILNLVYKKPTEFSDIPDDLKKPLLNRAADLSTKQGDILQHIRNKTGNSSDKLGQMDLAKQFGMGGPEIYYRLEQLIFLGLVTKTFVTTPGQSGINYYYLSDSYRKALAGQTPP